jgi:hypothetical protein
MASAWIPPNEGAVASVERLTTVALVENHAKSGATLLRCGGIAWLRSRELTFRGYSNPKT